MHVAGKLNLLLHVTKKKVNLQSRYEDLLPLHLQCFEHCRQRKSAGDEHESIFIYK